MSDQRPIRILLVDDSDVTLHLLSLMIRSEGYEVFTSTDPEAVPGLVGELNIDILVSDWSMPVLDGLELFKLVSRLHPDVVRIMLTAYPTLQLAIDAVNGGQVNRFLTKPMRAAEVRSALREAAWEVIVRRRGEVSRSEAPSTVEVTSMDAATDSSRTLAPTERQPNVPAGIA